MTKRVAEPGIRLRGVRHNNLKNFDLDLPTGKLIVITGLSGSGKSSLAFDTLFAEGQRRYIETFSPYARQFFDRMDKPQVDRIEGIPPAIAIEQRNAVKTTRSTVGTMTELCDYLKLLWPYLARLHCRQCGQLVRQEPPQVIWETLSSGPEGGGADALPDVLVTFDLPLSDKLSLVESLALVARQGYQRLLVDGQILRVDEAETPLRAKKATRLTVIQDRVRLETANRARFIEACEQAYHFGKGKLAIHQSERTGNGGQASVGRNAHRFSAGLHCAACDLDYREPTPALFSFNHPLGACPKCKGFGRVISIDYNLAVPDRSLTLAQGVVKPWRGGFSAECQDDLMKFCKARRVPTQVPLADLPKHQQDWVIQGDPDYGTDDAHEWPHAWYGVKGYFRWLEGKSYKMHVRVLLSRYRAYTTCPDCHGQRFQPEALLHLLTLEQPLAGQSSLTLADFYALPIDGALALVERLAARQCFGPGEPLGLALEEVRARLHYLVEVGLGYLTLDRPTRTLSGGETERVNLTTCLGTRLVNTLFVLDEPSVGLHPRDTARLVRILERLRDTGNTVVVVEHEGAVIRAADQIVDLGPGSGEAGGRVVFQGPFAQLVHSERSLTGAYLAGRKQIEIPPRRLISLGGARQTAPSTKADRLQTSAWQMNDAPAGALDAQERSSSLTGRRNGFPALRISGARRHNLKDLTVEIPLNRLVCLTGVSGSGKTTLVREVLLPAVQERLRIQGDAAKASDRLGGEADKEDENGATGRAASESVRLAGAEHLGNVVLVDQSPLGKTPRSNPAVYVGAFDHVREVFAQADAARQRGLNASAFSFNSSQGQCERCRGAGFEKVEMQFLSDVFIRCPDCNGRRYRAHILEVKLRAEGRDWSIADLLEATVDDAVRFLLDFSHLTPAKRAVQSLSLLREVGLGYLRLGQPINTLSGGESQRLKLVSHLAEGVGQEACLAAGAETGEAARKWKDSPRPPFALAPTGASPGEPPGNGAKPTLFLFDEPTTGLHFDDVRVLLQVFQRLVDQRQSVLVIEHNIDVIKCADWVIDLGPEAGERGGEIVAVGTPEDIAGCEASHTGHFLREAMAMRRGRQ